MKAILKTLKIMNFKGLKSLILEFPDGRSTINGANGTGKTTVFDAVQWLLFGKDSLDRQKFNVKPLNAEGKTTDHLEVDVEAMFLIFEKGEEIPYKLTLKKNMVEIWKKPRGQEEKVFSGHETTYYVNGVPTTMKDYDRRIFDICSEELFRLITNPRYFPSLDWKVQRETLVALVGGYATDESILAGHPEFIKLFNMLTGKTMEGFQKEIANNIRRTKEALEGIPHRIDELFKSLPENKYADSATYPGRIEILDKEISGLNVKKGSKDKQATEVNQERFRIQNEINRFAIRNQEIEMLVEQSFKSKVASAESEISSLKTRVGLLKSTIHDISDALKQKNGDLMVYGEQKEALIREWHEIRAEVFNINNSETICSNCERPWDDHVMSSKRTELERKFNENKIARIAYNTEKGKAKAVQINATKAAIVSLEESKNETTAKIIDLESRILSEEKSMKSLAEIDYKELTDQVLRREIMSTDEITKRMVEEYVSNLAWVEEWRQRIPEEVSANAQMDKEAMAKIDEEITEKTQTRDRYTQALVVVDKITATNKRIEELKGEQITLNQRLTELEEYDILIGRFDRVKVQLLENNINQLFKTARFKMFNTLINGSIEPTCECVVWGVPYGDLNNAMRINVGLDIIDGISKVHDIQAPIFIDNSEAVNDVRPMNAQTVLLRVTDSKSIFIV